MIMTREQVAALLDGTTPGPWRKRACDVVVGEGLTAKTICHFWRHWSNDEEGLEQTEPNVALTAAAPDLARQLLAAMDRLADADMAQAALVLRAADEWQNVRVEGGVAVAAIMAYSERIRALASDAGVKDLTALRSEAESLRRENGILRGNAKTQGLVDEIGATGKNRRKTEGKLAMVIGGQRTALRKLQGVVERHKVDRDSLAAKLAEAEAQVAVLREALDRAGDHLDFAADKMKGRCAGSDVMAVRMASLNVSAALSAPPEGEKGVG